MTIHVNFTPLYDQRGSIMSSVIRWALPRLAMYVFAAIGSMTLFVAGAAFYIHIWPGVHETATISVTNPILTEPALTVPLEKSPAQDIPVAEETTSKSHVYIGAQIMDKGDLMIGRVIRVVEDKRTHQKDIVIAFRSRLEVTIPFTSIQWKDNAARGTTTNVSLEEVENVALMIDAATRAASASVRGGSVGLSYSNADGQSIKLSVSRSDVDQFYQPSIRAPQ